MKECPYCHTTYKEIMQTGFVGCEHCYHEISELKVALKSMYGDRVHRGKKVVKDGGI